VKDDGSKIPILVNSSTFPRSPFVFGKDGELIQVNPAWHDMLGWDFDELRSVPFANFVHPDDVQATEDEFRIVIRGRRRRAEVSSIGNAVATAPTERSRGARSARTVGSARPVRTSRTTKRCAPN